MSLFLFHWDQGYVRKAWNTVACIWLIIVKTGGDEPRAAVCSMKINMQDAFAQWEYTTALPADENGLTNPYHGVCSMMNASGQCFRN